MTSRVNQDCLDNTFSQLRGSEEGIEAHSNYGGGGRDRLSVLSKHTVAYLRGEGVLGVLGPLHGSSGALHILFYTETVK